MFGEREKSQYLYNGFKLTNLVRPKDCDITYDVNVQDKINLFVFSIRAIWNSHRLLSLCIKFAHELAQIPSIWLLFYFCFELCLLSFVSNLGNTPFVLCSFFFVVVATSIGLITNCINIYSTNKMGTSQRTKKKVLIYPFVCTMISVILWCWRLYERFLHVVLFCSCQSGFFLEEWLINLHSFHIICVRPFFFLVLWNLRQFHSFTEKNKNIIFVFR